MKIYMIASEASPFVKTGGLGDVMGSLPAALSHIDRTVDVRLVLPMYRSIAAEYKRRSRLILERTVTLAWRQLYCGVWEYQTDGVHVYFIDNEYYFNREFLYGSYDDGERFAYFCRAAADILPDIGFAPDIVHCHDWQAALAITYLWKYAAENAVNGFYRCIKTVYTIHNIAYQGIYPPEILGDVFGLGEELRGIVTFDGCINLAKSAMVSADSVTTVSPTYANELLYGDAAGRLTNILANGTKQKLIGILNGIDTARYCPATDSGIVKNYGFTTVYDKAVNKSALQRELGLPVCDKPLVAMVSRLTAQKGFDLILSAADRIMAEEIQFVLLGTGDRAIEDFFVRLAADYPEKCAVRIGFDNRLAGQIYAAADIFLMPSQSEPCGLAQMIACHYGAVPVVHKTGGLADTITPFLPAAGEGNGFVFSDYRAEELLSALQSALSVYSDKSVWRKVVENAMNSDFSWDSAAKTYLELYRSVIRLP